MKRRAPDETVWRPRIERAVRYIIDHLAEPLRLTDVARAAHVSEFHFHRIFTALMGEPVGRFVTRRRLEQAAMLLAWEPRAPVTDIALRCGYSSVSNFSKAFSARYGSSPSQVRAGRRTRRSRFDPAKLFSVPPGPSTARREAILNRLDKTLRVERRPSLSLACLVTEKGYQPADIERTFARLQRQLKVAGVDGPLDAWGLAWDSPALTGALRCRYYAGTPVEAHQPLAPPLFETELPAGRWAVFPFSGPVSAVERHYLDIYSVWLPASGARLDDFVPVEHFIHDAPVRGRVSYDVMLKLRD